MPIELIAAIATFGFVTSVTPGPNNTYLLSAGANHGVRKSLRYINGIIAGLMIMAVTIWLGLGAVFSAFPVAYQVLKYLGFAYILYLASKVIRSSYKNSIADVDEPKFLQSLAFQFLNPKAWIVSTSFMATYVPVDQGLAASAFGVGIFLVVTYPGALVWALIGKGISTFLTDAKKRKFFNWAAGLLLIATMIPALFI